jgi:phosphoribosylanthranilate isomerase
MTWIKICGITNLDDALTASDAGADALGFVFYPKSPRHVTVETASAIVAKLPRPIERVGVFVNKTVEEVLDTVKQVGLTSVQLHGEEDKGFNRALFHELGNGLKNGARPTIFRSYSYKGKRVHKIHVAKNGDLFLETHGFRPGVLSGVLLDSSTAERRGGTGEPFDWERVQPWAGIINSISKLIVAGGLHPGNVQEAIHLLHPWGVDVSTGVEREPGKKDPRKIRAFVRAVRAMDEAS